MQVDDQFLKEMGLGGLQGEEKQKALENILYTLNMRVGAHVSELLNEAQLDKFEQLTSKEDVGQEGLGHWLEYNVPNYKQMVEEELQKMKNEASEMVEKVMGSRPTPA